MKVLLVFPAIAFVFSSTSQCLRNDEELTSCTEFKWEDVLLMDSLSSAQLKTEFIQVQKHNPTVGI